ncbi:hypothetical protein [Phenylobacterium montanum]|uniref:Uncharacterized protein n=1 Tax=Phenylobacterium montanum TaxID=2823693 RepID=A0A975G3P3_9CAUL|nr:hypothetical protein [Caulobacter sp. S6]QUD90560.1 hypothetical protein KCG34_12165 [Caulobacter sp. S6]
MIIDAIKVAQIVQREIEAYRVPAPHPQQLGVPLPPEWFLEQLAAMRKAVVSPYQLNVTDHWSDPEKQITRTVWIVADDHDGTLLAYDPSPDGDFVLVWCHADQDALANIRGDAVGCFQSR